MRAWRLAHKLGWLGPRLQLPPVPAAVSSLSIPGLRAASCSRLPPHRIHKQAYVGFYKMRFLDPGYRSPASLKSGIQDNLDSGKHPKIRV